MRKILVFQHVASEPLGHLDPLLRESGFRIRYVNFGREPHAEPDVRRYDGLVVLGGPMNVDQTDRHPHLGAQLLAAAMGGVVHPNEVPEIGWYRLHTRPAAHGDRLFRHFERRPHYVFQWHAYTFAPPPGAEPLAWTRNCRNQAYRLGDRAWGLQFHLEADAPLIERWLAHAEWPQRDRAALGRAPRRPDSSRNTRAPAGSDRAQSSRVRGVHPPVCTAALRDLAVALGREFHDLSRRGTSGRPD